MAEKVTIMVILNSENVPRYFARFDPTTLAYSQFIRVGG